MRTIVAAFLLTIAACAPGCRSEPAPPIVAKETLDQVYAATGILGSWRYLDEGWLADGEWNYQIGPHLLPWFITFDAGGSFTNTVRAPGREPIPYITFPGTYSIGGSAIAIRADGQAFDGWRGFETFTIDGGVLTLHAPGLRRRWRRNE